ncbi:AMP-binding protein [Gordonia sp. HNM0687]|uniref:AMP-binding protein n=1 Tax=Gordonia mangrovi TaxID=2665643 RepID=A0A6L7GP43_9ACTN|nr:AMP-binding protein [Gordonia mangrovi]MXP21684.1 AMP-binding protein [Gordonia mangrovi]UVF80418.1 AMP-binding protein [Gordonia mangrovi]
MTAFDYLPWRLAGRSVSAPAVSDDRITLTHSEFDARTAAVAQQLSELGVGVGDVVAVMLPNRAELVIVVGAAWRIGAAATPVNPAFTAEEASRQIGDSAARVVVTLDGHSPHPGAAGIHVDDLATEVTTDVPPREPAPDDLALVIYTSGSTGRPKGAMLTHANVDAMTSMMVDHFGLTPADHCMLILPLFHVNALMVSTFAPLRAGGQVTIVGTFSASRFFDDLARVRPTYFSAVPTIFALLAATPANVEPDTSSVRFAVCGAAPVSEELLRAVSDRFGFTMVEGYGLTEGTCASACNPVDGIRKLGTVGPAIAGQQIRVVDPDGHDVPVGERGEVLIGGPTVMAGYLNNPEATAATIVDGWLHTGDVGILDDDGYLQVVDRIKDMIIRGGENLYPKEIESALAGAPGVLEVAVVGKPDALLGEVPVAYVVPYPDADVSADELRAHCADQLTRVKVPAEITVLPALPKNPVGKIDKPTLRARLVAV